MSYPVARSTTAHIDIVTKTDKPGIDIVIKPGTKNESVHIPVLLSQSGLTEMVYNDFYIVTLLQMVTRIVPPMSNEIITLVKDTSLARIIAAYELTFAGYSFMKSNGLTWPLFYTGVFYLLFVGILTLLFNYIERRLDYFR